MTRDELRSRIDTLLGLESENVTLTQYDVELRYFSSTGVLLFTLIISTLDKRNWQVGGYANCALPHIWGALKRLHEEE